MPALVRLFNNALSQTDCAAQNLLKIVGGIDADVPTADGKDGFSCALSACLIHDLPHEVLRYDHSMDIRLKYLSSRV